MELPAVTNSDLGPDPLPHFCSRIDDKITCESNERAVDERETECCWVAIYLVLPGLQMPGAKTAVSLTRASSSEETN